MPEDRLIDPAMEACKPNTLVEKYLLDHDPEFGRLYKLKRKVCHINS